MWLAERIQSSDENKALQNSITARFTGKLILGGLAALRYRFSVPHDLASIHEEKALLSVRKYPFPELIPY
jgi:hypothetical protein